ncbi:MAG: ribokinase [Chloroflexi bacterium]|nr:ribokinase [Chloroflexota bacterium]
MSAYAVVQGSLNIDLVFRGPRLPGPGESVLGESFSTFPGGKGANQAVQLAKLGVETHMIGRVGTDDYGDQLIDSLEAAGVNTDGVVRDSDLGTGKGWVFIDGAGENYIIVVPEANMVWRPSDLTPLRALFTRADVFLCQLETPVPLVDSCLRLAKASSALTMLNAAPAIELPGPLFAYVDVLVLNQTEAAFYSGRQVKGVHGALAAAAELRGRGCGAAVITLGERGAIAVSQAGDIRCGAYTVDAVDVTAAGDSFCGGLAYALVNGQDMRDALQFACACGALTVTRAGAQPSLPTLAEIHSFMKRNGVEDGGQDYI